MNIIYKKTFSIPLVIAMLIQSLCVAQSKSVNRSDFIVDLYYGVSFSNFVVSNQFGVGKINKLTGPIGLKFETMVNDKIGLGIDLNYSHTNISWIDNSTYNNGSYYSYCNYDESHFRALLNFSHHFRVTENADTYSSYRVGYNNVNYEIATNNRSLYKSYSFFPLTVPVSLRIAIGHKFFLNNNIGINVEAGFGGGPIISAGLTYKVSSRNRNLSYSLTKTVFPKDKMDASDKKIASDTAIGLSIPRSNFSLSYTPYSNGYGYAGGLFLLNYSHFFWLSDVWTLSAQGGLGFDGNIGGDLSAGVLLGKRSLKFDATLLYFHSFEYRHDSFLADIGARYFFIKPKCSIKAYVSIPDNPYRRVTVGVEFAYHFQYK